MSPESLDDTAFEAVSSKLADKPVCVAPNGVQRRVFAPKGVYNMIRVYFALWISKIDFLLRMKTDRLFTICLSVLAVFR